ncbi:Ohr family peroxiredoxin [Variovorax sp. J22P240]|uniref:Ohr family peroxiredoxin n=1 Tax=Variovorax sp. J22P240 TaxID=3053514 RepID=UPI002577CC91|nr:Ohr family peroxiredoxin [Variovorax sp. J22P240]MDM0001059.1 Ohr family peroxiredoxin [Variovorax sp. J22P240]
MTQLAALFVKGAAPQACHAIVPLYATTVGVSTRHARSAGRAVSDDGNLDLALRLPEELGGNGGGANPEQLLAAGFAACFHGAMTLVAAAKEMHLPRDIDIASTVSFERAPSDGLFRITAELTVSLPHMDVAHAAALVAETEKACPYAKMAQEGMRCTVSLV